MLLKEEDSKSCNCHQLGRTGIKMKRRSFLFAALAAVFGLALTQLGMADFASAQDKKFKVGVSLPEAQNPFYIAMGNSIKKTFEEAGVEVNLLLAKDDVNEQVSQINDLIAAKVDAILVSPLNTEG